MQKRRSPFLKVMKPFDEQWMHFLAIILYGEIFALQQFIETNGREQPQCISSFKVRLMILTAHEWIRGESNFIKGYDFCDDIDSVVEQNECLRIFLMATI